jgi:diaminohydroxyphosphoribosylaminopyrimidine deaminase/5-amino-6-(5-phosphoribosylamino)uracil reductase
MKTAIQLAKKGIGRVSPNPLVGAVLVKGNGIVGKGFHCSFGGPHAELDALRNAKQKAKGADLYINLEPCSHFGKTPPCTDALIQTGIRRAYIGMQDPNPVVSGRGIAKLRKAGIEVEVGILEQECQCLNEIFIKFITQNVPFVMLKTAATLDGKIATPTGDSQWITNEASRKFVHRLRSACDAVLIGIGTVLSDDPLLTVRYIEGTPENPLRVILDSSLRIPLTARILQTARTVKTLIVTTQKMQSQKAQAIKDLGAQILCVPSQARGVDLKKLMKILAKKSIASVLIEGGSEVSAAALEQGIVDKIYFFYAPKIICGKDAVCMAGGKGVKKVEDAILVSNVKLRHFKDDILIEGYIGRHVHRNH